VNDDSQRFQTWGFLWDVLASRLVNLIGITEGATVLDVGTGGGSTLLASLERVGPAGKVLGLDKQLNHVEKANLEIQRCNCGDSKVFHMDATEMSFSDNLFDFAVSGFIGWGLNFNFKENRFTGSNQVMQEIVRVLKPGGRLGISSWLLQEDTEWMERFVSSYSHPARRTYVKETVEGWDIILANSDLVKTSVLHEDVEIPYPSLEAWWNEMMSYGWQSQIDSLSIEKGITIEDIKDKAFSQIEDYQSGEGITFIRSVLYALGTKQ
jgi:ubiquinone/menaquinone biosynthesis C-methylase UbiE